MILSRVFLLMDSVIMYTFMFAITYFPPMTIITTVLTDTLICNWCLKLQISYWLLLLIKSHYSYNVFSFLFFFFPSKCYSSLDLIGCKGGRYSKSTHRNDQYDFRFTFVQAFKWHSRRFIFTHTIMLWEPKFSTFPIINYNKCDVIRNTHWFLIYILFL